MGTFRQSNSLLFEWRSLEHVPVSETYFQISNNEGNSSDNPFDYCHVRPSQWLTFLISSSGGCRQLTSLLPSPPFACPCITSQINSIAKDLSGNYLVSLRGPSTVYNISSATGEINWRLGGKYR